MPKFLANILLLCLSSLVFLIIAEFALRMVKPHDSFKPHFPNMEAPFQNPDILVGLDDSVVYTTNSLGLRNSEKDMDLPNRILVLGGSTTDCQVLNLDDVWTQVLQDSFAANGKPISVLNAGVSGLNSGHHLFQIKEYLQSFENISAVMILIGINDFTRCMFMRDQFKPALEDERLIRKAFSKFPRQYANKWYQRTELWCHIRHTKKIIHQRFFLNDANFRKEKYQEFARMHKTLPKTDLMKVPKACLDDFTENISEIIMECQLSSMPLIFLSQPTSFDKNRIGQDDGVVNIVNRKNQDTLYSLSALEEGMNAFNEELVTLCDRYNIPVIPLHKYMPKDKSIFYDHCHYHKAGSHAIADTIMKYLKQDQMLGFE